MHLCNNVTIIDKIDKNTFLNNIIRIKKFNVHHSLRVCLELLVTEKVGKFFNISIHVFQK